MIWMSDSGITFSILPTVDPGCRIPPHCQPLSQAGSSPNRLRPLPRQLAKQKACEGGRDTGRALDVACVTRAFPRVSSFQRLPPRHSANIAHNVVETPANIRTRRHRRAGWRRPPALYVNPDAPPPLEMLWNSAFQESPAEGAESPSPNGCGIVRAHLS